uniref:Uncharacterized protein n=1 Tax=Scytodes thoracica TaxID=1112478 RepID=A0A0A0V635_SCYTH|nr:hypothetical protein [Scytodes thoracica]
MPDGAKSTDEDERISDIHQSLDFNLDDPMKKPDGENIVPAESKFQASSRPAKLNKNKNEKRQMIFNSIEFWMGNENGCLNTQENGHSPEISDLTLKSKLSRKAKKKKTKEHKRSYNKRGKREKKGKKNTLLEMDEPKNKNEYEEAPGITTPSKEPGFSAVPTPTSPICEEENELQHSIGDFD